LYRIGSLTISGIDKKGVLKMKTNRTAVKSYLVSLINFDGYNVTATTEGEKVRAAMQICRNEVGHMERRVGMQGMLEYWFSGLCSVVSLPYLYADIITTARHFSEFTEEEEEKLCAGWFRYMAAQFAQLASKHNA
jgi:hypothetical protein